MGTTNAYNETYTYDANGNIKTLDRYNGAATPVKIDGLTYGYNLDGNGKLINNRLRNIKDTRSSSLCDYDIDDQNDDNYLYDAIGNLTKDNAEGIDNIEWNAYGKIKKIIRTFSSAEKSLEFVYDAQGNRVCKIVKPRFANMDGTKTRDEWDTYNSANWLYTFYVRDASGNIMTTYTKTGSEIENNVLKLDEVMLYGSSRIGTREVNTLLSDLTVPVTKFSRALGLKRYEIDNHLGNVLATFTDRKKQVQSGSSVTGYETYIASSQDYYPFGMIMNGRNWNTSGYRFGFNGMENDNEVKGIGNSLDFGARIYDSRIGRWLSVDPLFKEYAPVSPYAISLNNPIIFKDENGEYVEGIDGKPVTYTRTKDGQIKWSSNATDDIKRVCTAMLKTRTGEQVFKDMQKTSYAIGIRISTDFNSNELGHASKLTNWNKKTNKVDKVYRVDIVLYEGSLSRFKSRLEEGSILPEDQGLLYQSSIELTGSIDDGLAAVLVHEGIHGTNKKNIQDATENRQNKTNNDVESLPEEKESQYLIESMPIGKMESRTAVIETQDKKEQTCIKR